MYLNCRLSLSDNTSLTGKLVGAPVKTSGEMVFTTGMVGYTEAMTDPSYYGQILVFAYPLIGNYGVPEMGPQGDLTVGFESSKIYASAVIFHEVSKDTFHWNSQNSIHDWMKSQNVPGIMGVDTRHLVCKIRNSTGLFGKISFEDNVTETRYETNNSWFDPNETSIIQNVSCSSLQIIGTGKKKIAVIDLGVKWNILRQLKQSNVEIVRVPWDYDLTTVDCDGWVISNGPGNPELTGSLVTRIQPLLKQNKPILGICLGHQILSLAAGAKTEKMTYGHRSHNQPVKEVGTHKSFITSQNHGYVVTEVPTSWEPWFVNVNDNTIEGIKHSHLPFRSVQFHPEAAGGPRDTSWIIEQFIQEVSSAS